MLKRSSLGFLSLAAAVALSSGALFAQDAPKSAAPADLSLDSLMIEAPKAPEEFKVDESLLVVPENASFDELFEFIEGLQEKLPQPKSQTELFAVVDAFSKTCLKVADKLFAMDLDAEQRERAVQLKVVALTTRANIDDEAAEELNAFVDENIKAAKDNDALIKAYQLKLQVLASAAEDGGLDKIDALADEMFASDNEELQIFAIEVKAQSFLTTVQKTGEFNADIIAFADSVVNDKNRADGVKEKALEMKLVALVIASELENEKEADEKNASYAEDAEKLFNELISEKYSTDLRKMVCQLRVQTLLDPNTTDEKATEKLEALVKKLADEKDDELYALGVAVKGQLLLNEAQKNADAIDALEAYAKKVYAQAKDREILRGQSIGLMIQAFRLKKDSESLLAFVDGELANNPSEDILPKLQQVKLSAVSEAIKNNPDSFNKYADFIAELAKDEATADAVSELYIARFVGALDKVAEGDANLDDYKAVMKQFKDDLLVCPNAVAGILMGRQSISAIGAKNDSKTLADEAFTEIIDFLKVADSEELNDLAQKLEAYQQQMELMTKQLAAQAAAQEEEAEEQKSEE